MGWKAHFQLLVRICIESISIDYQWAFYLSIVEIFDAVKMKIIERTLVDVSVVPFSLWSDPGPLWLLYNSGHYWFHPVSTEPIIVWAKIFLWQIRFSCLRTGHNVWALVLWAGAWVKTESKTYVSFYQRKDLSLEWDLSVGSYFLKYLSFCFRICLHLDTPNYKCN